MLGMLMDMDMVRKLTRRRTRSAAMADKKKERILETNSSSSISNISSSIRKRLERHYFIKDDNFALLFIESITIQ